MDHAEKIRSLLASNKIPQAITLCRKLCRQNPENPAAWFLLAGVHAHCDELDDVINCCNKTLSLDNSHFGASYNLAVSLQNLGKFQEAAGFYRRSIKLNPGSAAAHTGLGIVLIKLGDTGAAKDSLMRALSIEQNNYNALLFCGIANQALGCLPEAIRQFRTCLQLNRDSAEVHFRLGTCLNEYGSSNEAIASIKRALSIDPSFAPAIYSLAVIESASGNYVSASELFDRLLEIDEGNVDAIAGKALVLHYTGNNEQAYALVSPLIKEGKLTENAAIVYGTIANAMGNPGPAIESLASACNNSAVVDGNADVHFTLGDLLDKTGDYEAAFGHYKKANLLLKPAYHPDQTVKYFDRIISSFREGLLDTLPVAENHSDTPIFIVGMPRSGTSLIEQILSAHRDIFGAGELNDISLITSSLQRRFHLSMAFPECITGLTVDIVNTISAEYLDKIRIISGGTRRVTDKMPHNFLGLGLICTLFPDARIIHCKRNPIDTCLSIYFHHFTQNHPYTFDLGNLALYYIQYLRLMNHWESLFPGRIFSVEYEDIVNDLETSSRSLVDYCGVEWDENCLYFYDSDRTVTTPSYEQVSKPVYRNSAGRWKNYELYVDELVKHFPGRAA